MYGRYNNDVMKFDGARYKNFTQPILDLGSGVLTTGTNSPLDCLNQDLILRPYRHQVSQKILSVWPNETG